MDDNKLEKVLDKLDSRLDNIDVTLAAQHVSLKDHIRRTELLEDAVKPLQSHMDMVKGAAKLIGLASLLASIIEVILHLTK